MRWKTKAAIQNVVSLLPSAFSYALYYNIQRHCGNLRQTNPVSRLTAGIETWRRIKQLGYDPAGKVFLEIGTGTTPIVPLCYWLMGARRVVTMDLNPYLKAELARESLQYISDNSAGIQSLFGLFLDKERFDALLAFHRNTAFTVDAFLDLCHIEYVAPGDAANTELADRSIDFHTSYTVFEHIPPHILKQILKEGNRVVTDSGLFIHRIDYSDHFSHSDKAISSIHFLQYSDADWGKYAGNRYAYVNRLRHDDFTIMFESAGHRILATELNVDQEALELLKSGSLKLDARFKEKSEEVLSIRGSWITSQRSG